MELVAESEACMASIVPNRKRPGEYHDKVILRVEWDEQTNMLTRVSVRKTLVGKQSGAHLDRDDLGVTQASAVKALAGILGRVDSPYLSSAEQVDILAYFLECILTEDLN